MTYSTALVEFSGTDATDDDDDADDDTAVDSRTKSALLFPEKMDVIKL